MITVDTDQNQARVLHIGKYFPPDPGGMETYLRDLMASCGNMGTQCAALVHQSRIGLQSIEEHFQERGITLHITRVATWFRLLFTPISPTFPFALAGLIKQCQPCILHFHLPNPSAFWGLLLPSARKLPWVIHWQSDVLTPKSNWLIRLCYVAYQPLESAMLKRASKIITTSNQYLSSSEALAPFREKCCVIPLGITDRFGDYRPEEDAMMPHKPLKILAIGRLAHYKGFDVLLRAISRTENTELDIVGDGKLLRSLKLLARSLKLTTRVRFHGAVTDQARDELVLACDCLCLPSIDRTESFGIVLLEAMSAGKACVISDVPGSGVTSVVEADQTGLHVPPGDHIALAEAVQRLGKDRDLLLAMGRRGREKFVDALTIEVSTRGVLAVYNDLRSA